MGICQQNKADRERERQERLADREELGGPAANSARVPRSKCGLSQDVFSKMDEGEDKGTQQQSPVKSIEITSILNGLQGSNTRSAPAAPHAHSLQIRKLFDSDAVGWRLHVVTAALTKVLLVRPSTTHPPSASELSTDDSEREDNGGSEHNEQDHHSCKGSGPRKPSAEPPGESRASPPSEAVKNQEAAGGDNLEVGKRRSHLDPDVDTTPAARKRKSEAVLGERTPKSQSKAKTRNARNSEWLPGASPRKTEERGAASSASSDDDSAIAAAVGPQPQDGGPNERNRSKSKGTAPSKKYNGVKDKSKAARQAAFWEVPEKRPKMSGGGSGSGEEQKAAAAAAAAARPKGQKDVWSSIQAQWPKKTLKDLFSDSDTEAANSPPPPPPPFASSSCPDEEEDDYEEGLEDTRSGDLPEDEEARSEGPADSDKLQEFPSSSGSNSVLNTPPTTPESPPSGSAGAGRGATEDSAQQPQPSPTHSHLPPTPAVEPGLPLELPTDGVLPLPPPAALGSTREEAAGVRSETDSSTVEVESLGGELQELTPPSRDDEAASPSKAFDVGLSCSSSSCGCSHDLSGSSQLESEPKSRGKKND